MIYDLLFEMLYGYNFEMIFWKYFHSKKDCADRHFEITFFLRLGQHNLQIDFYAIHFEMINAFHFEMRAAKFSYTKKFSSGKSEIFYWRKSAINSIFRIQIFTQCQCPYTCVEIHFIKKGGIWYVRF